MKKNFLVRNYSLCWRYLNECRWYIVFALGIFFFFFLFGFVFPIFFRENIHNIWVSIFESMKGMSTLEVIRFLFLNNLKVSFLALLLGIGLGIFPIINAVINGYMVGFVARGAAETQGILVLWKLLPHGIFELPAIFFSIGMGIKLGFSLLSKKNPGKNFKRNLKESFRFFVFVVIPFLLIAGIIEGLLIGPVPLN